MVRLAFVTIGSLPAAEDVVQDVVAELYRWYDQIELPVAYLRRAVVSRCVSEWSSRRSWRRLAARASVGAVAFRTTVHIMPRCGMWHPVRCGQLGSVHSR